MECLLISSSIDQMEVQDPKSQENLWLESEFSCLVKYLTQKLEHCSLSQAQLDRFLFIGETFHAILDVKSSEQ